MISRFIEQIQNLMEIQPIKIAEAEVFYRNELKYIWLSSKKVESIILSFKDEFKLRQALTKVSVDDQIVVLKKLMKWLNENPEADAFKIPEITLQLINTAVIENLINETNFTRINNFRNSLRRFSILSNNRISSSSSTSKNPVVKTRSVTFKEHPVIYKIYNN